MVKYYLNDTNSSMVSFNDEPHIIVNIYIRAGLILLYSLIFVLCFSGNLALIWVVTLEWKKRRLSKFGLLNMAVANFTVSLFCILQNLSSFLFVSPYHTVFGELTCKMQNFISNVCHTASIVVVVNISLERYIVLMHPLRYRQILTTWRLVFITVTVWMTSAVINIPSLIVDALRMKLNETDNFVGICRPIDTMFNSQTGNMFHFFLMYLLPLALMSTLYCRIGLSLRQNEVCRIMTIDEERTTVYVLSSSASKIQSDQKQFGPQLENATMHHATLNTILPTDVKDCDQSTMQISGASLEGTLGSSNANASSTLSPIIQSRKTAMGVYFNPQLLLVRYDTKQLVHIRGKQRRRVVGKFMIDVLTFAVLNLPFHAQKLYLDYDISAMTSDANSGTAALALALVYANCALNPILYAFISRNFQSSIRPKLTKILVGSLRGVAGHQL